MISLHLLTWCVPDDRARHLGAAAVMDPTRPVDADGRGVYLNYRDTLVVWSARLRQHLTQVAAFQWVAKSARPVRRPDGSLGAPSTPLTTAWLLRPLQGRRMLGDALSRMKITPAKRQVLQTIAARFLATRSSLGGTSSRLQRVPSAIMQTSLRYTFSVYAQL